MKSLHLVIILGIDYTFKFEVRTYVRKHDFKSSLILIRSIEKIRCYGRINFKHFNFIKSYLMF